MSAPLPLAAEVETAPQAPRYVLPFGEVGLDDIGEVGGKNASLGELIAALGPAGIRVPDGFAITAAAFRLHLSEAGLDRVIYTELDRLDVRDVTALATVGRGIRERVAAAPLPAGVAAQLEAAYRTLSARYGEALTDVAVRSSATAEDLPSASFAGQQESYLNVRGREALDRAVRSCFASLFTDRAIVYRVQNGFRHRDVALSVGVQKMVRSDLGSAGVIFTLDTESGFRDVVLITGAWGLGETVVKGRVRPDEFWVHKPTLREGHRPILRREIAEKAVKLVYAEGGGASTREVRVSAEDRARAVLSDDEVLTLARWALAIEEHYTAQAGRPTPMDIEWARDGRTGEIFIVQARPETVHSQRAHPTLELWRRRGEGKPLVTGRSVGGGVAAGPVRVVLHPAELEGFRDGEVLVAPMTDPDWEPVLKHAAAVVTDEGGRTCHAAIVSRELGIPCVVGTIDATRILTDGRQVTVSCAEGDDGKVYDGLVRFERTEIDPATLPVSPVPLMLNLANPDRAFHLAQLPSAGVGLVRIEFVISSWIGVHPMALVHPERVADPAAVLEIRRRIAGSPSGPAFFIERLASGVAQIAAAFHPRPVIVRFSDFKTNEYAGLLGGAAFEPTESNPMIGFRGASRYYDERYREGFALECAAIRRVREDMGLTNVKVMIPFCRTIEEGRRVIAELGRNGLRRGEGGLEVYVMCEIPNNVILAEEFAELFDGFSIGSNDLTQLALGVDRDSELLAHLFDERDQGVKRLIRMVVDAAHRRNRPVGICGQAPSDFPDFAAYLAEIGIDSMSLNPDSLARVAERLAAPAVPAG
ncbi:MAG TPA: phosphoenolpyruvate synthase [Gemmatimonadales bacterium]|nr:phosphoenolpyruvate synthase [Gemmatimonadales bacterium]